MNSDPPSPETALHGLQPAPLDPALLSRLDAAAQGTLTRLSSEELEFEQFLRTSSPAKLPPEFLTNLEKAVRDIPFRLNENILLFPKANSAQPGRKALPAWRAAAAVALLGALSAWVMPALRHPANPQFLTKSTPSEVTGQTPANLVPASFKRGLTEVHDEGIVWKSNNQPHSLVRLIYKDQMTQKDANGRTFQVEHPRVEYMLVPAKTD